MPSESDVIRRLITAPGPLMTEGPALPPGATPISRLHPRHAKQLLMSGRTRTQRREWRRHRKCCRLRGGSAAAP
ncbi:hypothetical protein EYF80_051313 [Liparis tanakae]|uniref:Uncharacterized protein n=1 Tax=Liparis tanakae TaxID=230148 RepID=A0A4Z2FDR5_9TELE|nr:hypothetical protein EYF80_051313 [Liparis tanakae]